MFRTNTLSGLIIIGTVKHFLVLNKNRLHKYIQNEFVKLLFLMTTMHSKNLGK